MADITQSFSQLLLTYGPGAMLDLPDQAVIVSGLQGWRYGPNMKTVAEDRLIALLRDQLGDKLSPTFSGLRHPPEQDEERRDDRAPGVEVLLFPSWFTVDDDASASGADGDHSSSAIEKRRRMVEFHHLTVTKAGKLSYRDDQGKRREVNPIRFVAACTKGHLQDISWRFLVHRNGDQTCRKPMHWVERGVSSDPSDISVRCTCGSMLTMADLYKPKFLGTCRAESPWLQPQRLHDEECGIDLRLLPRSATNTYFAQTVTVISLTNSDDRVRQTVQEHRPTIDSIRALPNFIDVLRSLPHTKDAFSEFSNEEILRALDDETGEAATTSANPRIAEFDILASGTRFIGHDGPTSHLFAETLPLAELGLKQPWSDFLAGVVKVHRLREVTCLYGFTRLEPPPTAAESELDEIQLAVDGADLARNVEWLPAIEQFGEGIFLHVNPDFLNRWRGDAAVGERTLVLREGEAREAEKFGRPPSHLGAAYWTLHSLSHSFMSELSLECGYPLSSLKERVYSSGSGQADRFGLLIYTSTAGGQGTLGGLSGMAHRVGELLSRAMKRLELCSNDPICAEHSPNGEHDDRHLHGAACHACLLIPETSCEARNNRLDRGLLVPTVVAARYACFEVL
ncbi:DUF1998 domain-containing protein [Sinorhizobium fredii]|uniref:DUF1998 domain-containing protein n=1 Tax=Rhizobium fredii TaxID=380 RepID=A0A844ACD2_RHIFR|nr:DUF1998 domain-containing protein [Sinorhizobium fredii]MQX10177.1 DUF1998 domain-containing protein [Sinorhizobium fredii]GEC32162.1 hypothetical protein EFR01_23330 [Sinorhizobium fredii]GLS07382.1 hypothetical protein GCM10007864_10090 [Sinorhizobium fredii]